ncbi:unnamed protein product, partial [Symbiodinium sp. CCMP2592]
EPGVDEFYKMVQKHWGSLLPKVGTGPVLQVIDLEGPMAARPNVKREIPEVIAIEDDDDAKMEEMEFKSLSEENLTVEDIQQKIDYLRACCDDGYGVIVLEEADETQAAAPEEIAAEAASAVAAEEALQDAVDAT